LTTIQIIVAVCSFAVFIAVSLIAYIWLDAKSSIKHAVTDKQCDEYRGTIKKDINNACEKLRNHHHNEAGKVEVEL
jgi:hypothetical protein